MIESGWARLAWDVFQGAVLVGLAYTQWVRSPGRGAHRAVDALADRVAAAEGRLIQAEAHRAAGLPPAVCQEHLARVARLEARMEAAPSIDDLGRIHARIDDVDRRLSTMGGEMAGMTRALSRIETYLMEHGR